MKGFHRNKNWCFSNFSPKTIQIIHETTSSKKHFSMFRKLIGLCAVVFCFHSCVHKQEDKSNENNNNLSRLEWLIGSWVHDEEDGYFSENWTQVNDSVLSGFGYLFLGEDTIFSETISLEQKGEDLFYIVSAQGQNDGKSVQFRLTSDNDGKFVFEKPEHDFPKRITYQFIDNEHFQAVVEGEEEGETRSMVFDFSRK
jgi:hypothetical protein